MLHSWTVGRYIVCTRIRLLLLICPFIFSFVFLSNFRTLHFLVTLFFRNMGPWRLKLGTHVDSGQMYSVYWNQAAAPYSPFIIISSFFFLSNFQTLKFFVTLFLGTVRPWRLKLGTHMDSEQMYLIYRIRLLLLVRPFIFYFQFSNITIFRHTFLRNCEALKVEGQWTYVSRILESGYCCLFIPLFLYFSFSQFSFFFRFSSFQFIICLSSQIAL